MTFGFEHVGILFYEEVSDSLYWVFGELDMKDSMELKSENIIRLPYTLGLTGRAIT